MNLEFLITRSIYEEPKISQRDLAKKFFVSLGKINGALKKAVANGLLSKGSKNGNYKITEAGIDEIKKHKVDAAIIFACGMGIRLAPLTYDTPKCFIKIKGERMIERQISQLKASGIDDITIMVGYLKEKFDYLVDKYGVKLIYNDEYKEKNTLATFYHAIDTIRNKNVYVCVSDVYITNNLYHTYECEPYYIGAYYEDCKNEWRYIANSKNEIKGVELGGKNDFCLVGPCFLTKEFLEYLMPLIEEYYHKTSTDNYYWEDVLVRHFKDLPHIYLYKLGSDGIYEFDTLKDIRKFDVDNVEFGSEAITFVSKAFKIKDSEIKDIECIKEGLTNKSYKFSYNGETYMARVPGEGTSNFINRVAEGEAHKLVEKAGLTEENMMFDENTGYKISKYFEGARGVDIEDLHELSECMKLYAKFHTLDLKIKASCDIIDKIDEYLSIIKKRNIEIYYEDFDEVLKEAREIERYIISMKRPKTLCHGDPNPGNVLITKKGYKLIDFEYAGMADPLSDISLFGVYVGFDAKKTFSLYEMYKKSLEDIIKNLGQVSENVKSFIPRSNDTAYKLVVSYMALGGLYNTIWAIVREGLSSVEYGEFGLKGYRNFKENYKIFKNL